LRIEQALQEMETHGATSCRRGMAPVPGLQCYGIVPRSVPADLYGPDAETA
jgi:hypothetical protein